MEQDDNVLRYKNFYMFYKILYDRLFVLIDIFIDEKDFNIKLIKNKLIDFLDSYSYYLSKQKLITKEEKNKSQEDLLKEMKEFDNFYNSIKDYPSQNYNKIRLEYLKNNNDLSKLSKDNYKDFIKEYYIFFDNTLKLLKDFINITAECGFLPNIKSKNSLKSIGFVNYDAFFTKLEELKLKVSEITSNVTLSNSFKSRRSAYCLLIIFSPYFQNSEIFNKLESNLNFKFIDDEDMLNKINKANNYTELPFELNKEIEENILIPLRNNISYIKRYISYEFGELDMSPKITKKYSYDPTGV